MVAKMPMKIIIYLFYIHFIISSVVALVSSKRGGRIHYKTTYACEGNPLHLTCEEGSTIHLVRANYGRFSISICNDGGRLDLNVICMSYRSFLIMSDRCSQKSNCSVVVSSKIFGDPCPGTLKYLEVQYHCVHGGDSSLTTTKRPPIQMNIPLPASSNSSLIMTPVLATTPSPSDGDMNSLITDSDMIAKTESGFSSNSQITTPFSSTSDSRLNHINHIEIVHSADSQSPQLSLNAPENREISPTLPPNTRINTPIKVDISSPPFPPQLPPPPVPPFSIEKAFPITDIKADYCPPIFVRSLFWNWTRRGEVADQKCPGGATGLVKWECSYNPITKTTDWMPDRPDFSQCRSLWLDNLEDRLNNDEPVIRIANELALMTLTKALFCEDLQRIASIVQKTLSHAMTSMQNLQTFEVWHRHQVLKELLMFIVEAVSNLLDNAQDDAWLDLNISERKKVASKLLKGLELSALLLADNTNQDGSFAVAKPNVLVSVHVLDTRMPISLQFPTVEDTRGTIEWIRMEDSLFLPAQALLEYSKEGLAKVAFLAYYRIEDLLKPDFYVINERKSTSYSMFSKLQNMTSTSLAINSRVIGAALSNDHKNDQKKMQLSQPITVILRHIQEENVSNPKCVYWDVERKDWLSDGCWMQSTNATHTVCMCSHLTHFALLMDIRPIDLLVTDSNWQKLVAIIGCAIAMLILVFITTIVYIVSAGNTEAVSIHRNVCSTLLIAEMIYLIGIYRTDIPLLCGLTAGSLQFFLLSTLLWTFLESFDLYLNLIDMYESVKSVKRLLWYYMIAYGGPTLIIIIALFIDPSSYGTPTHCWLRTDNYFCLSFVGPAIAIIFGGLVFVLISCFVVLNNSNNSTTIKYIEETKLDLTRSGIKWIVILLLLQCLTWIFGFIHVSAQTSPIIAISFAVSNICLAIFVTLFCVIKTDNIQHHKLIRSLHFLSVCFDEINCSTTKTNVAVSDSYVNRPVVTQVSATQVAGITQHQQQQQQQVLPVLQVEQQGSPLQATNSLPENEISTIRPDRPYISAQLRPTNTLYNSKGGTTGPILVNPINTVPNVNVSVGDINALVSQNLADYECKLQQIRHNSLNRPPKNRRKIRVHHNQLDDITRYGIHCNLQTQQMPPNLYNQFIEHIYESIDSDSLSSGIYDRHNRFTRRPPAVMSQINDFYSGTHININPTCAANDDNWSQNSSLSYGPPYDDRPLLIGSQYINNSPNVNKPLISQNICSPVNQNCNFNIYDKSREELNLRNNNRLKNIDITGHMTMPSMPSSMTNITTWNIDPSCGATGANSDLPDLIQEPNDVSNNMTSVFADTNNSSSQRFQSNTANQRVNEKSQNSVKFKAYC
ncbi:latrophilin Cirl-like isoform X2 [Oppia nitens]|uniref:latrophilin Cirl-like isoform X2 n=1 Tax=Oppia nitens TaxID=1686743 RepID=UPI0023DB2C06|nr:latrophilin Cirl-like isoform X2 [Oppia nitens]